MPRSDGTWTFIENIRNVLVTYKGTMGDGVTLADVSKIARVEPITLISSSLNGTKELYEILHGVLNIYAAYYLQAVNILAAELSDVRILKILDKTNPDRDIKTVLAAGYTAYEDKSSPSYNLRTLSLEGCKYRLPMLVTDQLNNISTENLLTEDDANALGTSISKIETFEKLGSAVGKVINVEFTVRNKEDCRAKPDKLTIPVVVKLDNMVIPSEVIDNILVSNKNEITLGSRFREALAGRISFIKDFILCSDIIKQQKKTMIKDPTGYYASLIKRINNSKLYSALTGNISLAGVSGIVVISEEDEREVQKHIGGKLTNKTTRELVFNNTSAFFLVVVDREWENVSIYVRDIDSFSTNSFDSFKGSSNKGSDNIADLIKAFSTTNTMPSF